jgi:hypothetical protein
MRNRAAALLILTLSTSCSHKTLATKANTNGQSQPSTTSGILPLTAPASIPTLQPLPTMHNRQAPPVPTKPHAVFSVPSQAASAANEYVDRLIRGQTASIPNPEIWKAVVSGGHIIQTTTLAESANRSTIAVSVAFETPIEGALTEPIALRLEMLMTVDGWTITAIGYL